MKEIPVPEDRLASNQTTAGFKYYLTLNFNDLRVKLGDCVYLFRKDEDKPNFKSSPKTKTKSNSSSEECKSNYIIFRVQNLAIDEKGKKLLYGHHFLRPSETYHEPNRKFFVNEVLKSPLFEWVPIEEVKGLCFVLDLNNYCKGRPKGFNKIAKVAQFPVNTKSYAFDMFPKKLSVKRTYSVIIFLFF